MKRERDSPRVRVQNYSDSQSEMDSARSIKDFDKETDNLVRELIASQQRELKLFERNWIYQHSDVIRKAQTAFSIRDVEERERVLKKETNMQEQYAAARRRLLAKQEEKLEKLYRDRKLMKEQMQPPEDAKLMTEKRISEIRRKAGIQVDPRFRHLREQPNSQCQTTKRIQLGRLDPRRPRTTESTLTRRREVQIRPKMNPNPTVDRAKMIDSSKMFLVSKSKFNNVPQVVRKPKPPKIQQFNIFDDDSLDRLFKERSARQEQERIARERQFEEHFRSDDPSEPFEEEEEEHDENESESEPEPEPEPEPTPKPKPQNEDLASSIRKKFELLKKAAEQSSESEEEEEKELPPDPSTCSSPIEYSYTEYSDSDHIRFGYSSDSDPRGPNIFDTKSFRRKK